MNNLTKRLIGLFMLGAVSSCSVGCLGSTRPAPPADPNQATVYLLQQMGFLGMVKSMTEKDKNIPVYHEISNTQNNRSDSSLTNQINDLKDEISELKREQGKVKRCNDLVDEQIGLW